MKKLYMMVALLLILIVTVAPLATVVRAQTQPKTIVIGALLPLTGDLSDYGQRALATLQVGVQDVNAFLAQNNAWFRVKLLVQDTATNPDQAVARYNALVAAGVKFIIGPMTSASAKKVRTLATKQNVILISPSSTAISLAIPGDNLFRFCPADNVQSAAVSTLVKYLHIKAAVLIIRADTWGIGLEKALEQDLKSMGVAIKPPLEYNPESPDFASIASQANSYVQDLISKYGAEHVAVYLVAFKEATELFTDAISYSALKNVIWIGSDGTAKLTTISGNPIAAKFAATVLFINPLYAPAATKNQQIIAQKVESKIHQPPDAYSYAAYDALWAIALSLYLKGNSSMTASQMVNLVKYELEHGITESKIFAEHSSTGAFPLNAAGDRATADYDFWVVYSMGGKYGWYKVGKYFGDNQSIAWTPLSNGKTYPELMMEKYHVTTSTTSSSSPTSSSPTSSTSSTSSTMSPVSSSTTSTSPTQTTTKSNHGVIVAAVVIIIIIIIIAAWAVTRKR